MSVIVTEQRHTANSRVNLTIKIDCKVYSVSSIISADVQSSFKYLIGSPAIKFALPKYYLEPAGCIKSLQFSLYNTEINGLKIADLKMPSFIQLDSNAKVITIFGQNIEEAMKSYTF